MTTLFDTGEEYVLKNDTDGDTFIIGLFNANQDNLSDSDDIGNITSEPNGQSYNRQTSSFSAVEVNNNINNTTVLADWVTTNDTQIEFDVSDSTNTVNSYFIAKSFQSADKGDTSPELHLIIAAPFTNKIDLSEGNTPSQGDNVLTVTLPVNDVGITLKPDFITGIPGRGIFTTEISNNTIFNHTLGTSYDTSTFTFDERSFNTSFSPNGLEFNDTGDVLYTIADDGTVYQYKLGVAYDISNRQLDTTSNIEGSEGEDIKWNDDGTKLFILTDTGDTTSRISEYTAPTPFDISSVSKNTDLTPNVAEVSGMCWNDDGTRMYIMFQTGILRQYTLNTPFDISTVSSTTDANFTDNDDDCTYRGYPRATYEYTGTADEKFNSWKNCNMSTQDFQGSTGTGNGTASLVAPEGVTGGVTFNDDGTKLYEIDSDDSRILEVTLSTPFDISTNTGTTRNDLFGAIPHGLIFNQTPKYIS